MPPSATTSRSSATRRKRPSWYSPRRWASTRKRRVAALPRRAEVPFDSEYKFMATFHDRPDGFVGGIVHAAALRQRQGRTRRGAGPLRSGAVARRAGPDRDVRDEILAANQELSERGLRVLAFAARDLDDAAMSAALADPMAAVTELVFVALVGIIDPLRTEAKDAVRVALDAGIDVRMITGDHTVTARAIADELGLGARRDHRHRTAAPDRCRGNRPASRSCTCSGGSRPRTSYGWPGSCRSRVRSSR